MISKGLLISWHSWSIPVVASSLEAQIFVYCYFIWGRWGSLLVSEVTVFKTKEERIGYFALFRSGSDLCRNNSTSAISLAVINSDWKLCRCLPSVQKGAFPLIKRAGWACHCFLNLTLGTLGSVYWKRKPLTGQKHNSVLSGFPQRTFHSFSAKITSDPAGVS